jgi:hypothetical protein
VVANQAGRCVGMLSSSLGADVAARCCVGWWSLAYWRTGRTGLRWHGT